MVTLWLAVSITDTVVVRVRLNSVPVLHHRLDSVTSRRYRPMSRMRRFVASRIVLLFAVIAFVGVGLASAGHVHAGTAAAAVKSDCQLCAVAQARFDVLAVAPALFGLALLAWLMPLSPAAFPQTQTSTLPPSRAPPLQ